MRTACSKSENNKMNARTMKSFPLTAGGHAALRAELERRLKAERPQLIERIAEARGMESEPSESPEFVSALEAQAANEVRIADLADMLARAEVIDPSKLSGKTVRFGATVTLIDEDTGEKRALQIVGESESDLSRGKISCMSPVARSLIGQSKGASVEVLTPRGPKTYEIRQLHWR
jgi:transcription elongation factor GreA